MATPTDTRVACAIMLVLQMALLGPLSVAEYGEDFNIAFYNAYIGITIMMLVGFGYLMAFLKRYGLGAVGFTFIITALCIELNVVLGPLIPYKNHAVINAVTLMDGNFAAATVLISFGCLIGKASPTQLVLITVIESVVFQVNRNVICVDELHIADAGGTIVIHFFGAYFGLACALVLGKPPDDDKTNANEATSLVSDLFSLVGTVFLWIYWPSFNGGLDFGKPKHANYAITNTVIALCASCVASFSLSGLMGGRFSPSHVQNATLAGGVAVGAIAHLKMGFAVAAALGAFAGMVSTVGYHMIQPFLLKKIGLHDSCGVHNLHGLPGWIGSLASVVAPALHQDTEIHYWSSKSKQAQMQIAATGITLVVALVSGALTGLLVKVLGTKLNPDHSFFHDSTFWAGTDDSKYGNDAFNAGDRASFQSKNTSTKVSPETEDSKYSARSANNVHALSS